MAPVTVTSFQSHSVTSDHPRSEGSFSDNVAQLLDRIDYKRVDGSGEERESISRLRYKAYLREGAISPNHTRTFSDPYDETDNAYLFGLYLDGELASSMRIHVGSREHPNFPTLEVFSDVLQPELDAGKVIIDLPALSPTKTFPGSIADCHMPHFDFVGWRSNTSMPTIFSQL